MKLWANILKAVVLIAAVVSIVFNVLLYNFCERQKDAINALSDQQKAQFEADSHQFKDQQNQIERISKDLENAAQQIKDQNSVLTEQKDALADVRPQADAIKQEMKSWQKDYAAALADLDKKTGDSQVEIKSVKNSLNLLQATLQAAVEKIAHLSDSQSSGVSAPAVPEK
jgi:chromosome segregation ATPase